MRCFQGCLLSANPPTPSTKTPAHSMAWTSPQCPLSTRLEPSAAMATGHPRRVRKARQPLTTSDVAMAMINSTPCWTLPSSMPTPSAERSLPYIAKQAGHAAQAKTGTIADQPPGFASEEGRVQRAAQAHASRWQTSRVSSDIARQRTGSAPLSQLSCK